MTKISVEQELYKAKVHEKKGEITEAKNIYLDILRVFPKNLRVQKKLAELNVPKQTDPTCPSEEVIKRLIKLINQNEYSVVVNQAQVLAQQFPDSFIIWNILGVANKSLGNLIEASKSFKKVIELNPNLPDGFNNLALAQQAQGKLDEALELFKKALMLNPESYIFHTNKGIILQEQGKFDESLEAFKKALSFNSKYVEAYYGMANTFLYQDKQDSSLQYFKKTVLLNPNYTQAYFNMAVVLKGQDKLNEAIEACNKSISLQPDYAEAYNNLGAILKEQGKLNEAIQACNKAISLKPDYADSYNNLATILRAQGKIDGAIEACNKAISLQPDYADAYYNLSFSYNLKGEIKKGLEFYEWRLKKKKFPTKIPRDHLIWDGKKSISGKKFLVYEEQGLGDTIQFSRYLPLLKKRGAEVIFKVKQKMHVLIKTLDESIILVNDDPDDNIIDFETPLLSLPYLLNTNLNKIPSMVSYLSVDHNKIISWSKRLSKATFKVGICWQGSKNKIDFGRSFPLALFENISKLKNVELISLHKGEGEKQIKNIDFDLTILGNDFDNGEDAFIDTAAVMLNCDLIITSDTAIAHLAGALGCSTWVLLKKIPDWRWMLDRNDSPWYPSMKLYRQKELDNWEKVFERIKKDLQSLLKLKEH